MNFNINNYIYKSTQTKLFMLIKRQRFNHSVRVALTAGYLAKKYNININKTILAGFLHDCGKGLSINEIKKLIKKEKIRMDIEYKSIPGLWHGIIGEQIAKKIFGINDTEILKAIKYHSIGFKNMTKLQKIIYISDYIELGRKYKSSRRIRKLLYINKITLNNLLLAVLKVKLNYLLNKLFLINSGSITLYNSLIKQQQ